MRSTWFCSGRRAGLLPAMEAIGCSWGRSARQATPTGGLYPVSQWKDGEEVRDDQIISLPADWQPGVYGLQVDGKTLTDVDVR